MSSSSVATPVAALQSRSHARRIPVLLAIALAAVGGYALDLATPSVSWWPAAFLGVLCILASVWQQHALFGLALGAIAGGAFWLPHIHWLTLYLGPVPWLGLCAVMITWFALFGFFAAAVTRAISLLEVRVPLIVIFQALSVAGLWVVREQVQSNWPYGGFAWGRLAITQAESPLAPLVSWLGFAGLSGLIAFSCALVVGALAGPKGSTGAKIVAVLAVAIAVSAMSLVPVAQLEETGTLRVAAVQGNSKSAIFDDRENGDVIRDHIDATRELLDELEANGEQVDLIVWPENSGEFQLPDQHYRSLEVQRLAERAGAPIVVGSVLQNADGTYTNSSLVFDGSGSTDQRYDKRRPVPFAEYMPNRAFFRSLAPELVDMVQLEYSFGKRPAVLDIDTPAGLVRAGIAICFDIVFDDHAVALMNGLVDDSGAPSDAQLILAQTNNADFGHTDQSAQQLQIATLRAIETGRALVNISTVGTSAIVLSDGELLEKLAPYTSDTMVGEVPLVTGETPALKFGTVFAAAWVALAILGMCLSWYASRRAARK